MVWVARFIGIGLGLGLSPPSVVWVARFIRIGFGLWGAPPTVVGISICRWVCVGGRGTGPFRSAVESPTLDIYETKRQQENAQRTLTIGTAEEKEIREKRTTRALEKRMLDAW